MNNLELLKWQVDMGADEAVDETPSSKFGLKQEEKKDLLQKTPEAAVNKPQIQATPPTSPKNAAEAARKLADSCNNLQELEKAVKDFDGCSIKKTATNTVFSDGSPDAQIMFIGEAPGAQEDIEGIPFCGASGKLLDTMLKWAGFTRDKNFYISNIIFWRPPGNRKPTPEEIETCRPFVEKHISLISPKLLVLIGGTATTALLDSKTGITKLRGKYYDYTNCYLDKSIPVGIIFHPAYLLRSPGQKRLAWQDILSLKHKLAEL